MNKETFAKQIGRLEKLFNKGQELDPAVQTEYYNVLKMFYPADLSRAIDIVIQNHRPYPNHVFPSLSLILEHLEDIIREKKEKGRDEMASVEASDYCAQCNNVGYYLNDEGLAAICSCSHGALKQARIKLGNLAKEVEVQTLAKKLGDKSPPVRGNKEWNSLGFWEDTKEEHDKWMAKERKILDDLESKEDGCPF